MGPSQGVSWGVMERVQLSGPNSCPVGDTPLPQCLLMAGRVKPPQQKGCLRQRLQGKPKGLHLALLCRQGGPAWGVPASASPLPSAHRAHRGTWQSEPTARGAQVWLLVSCNL